MKDMPNGDADRVVPLPTEARARIGERLRALYGRVLDEPVPDRFGDLLDQLAAVPDSPAPPHANKTEPNPGRNRPHPQSVRGPADGAIE
jgi:hypothetical protein